MAVEAMKAAVQAMAVAIGESNSGAIIELTSVGPKLGGLTLKQPTFDLNAMDKYTKLKNFRLEVHSTFKIYTINNTEKLSIIKHWIGRQDLQFIEALTKVEQEICNTMEGVFNI